MKTIITTLLIFAVNVCISQTPKTVTTYYDFKKTIKKEVYQTDANGTKNGTYKNYDQEGALRNEGAFKFGKMNGVFIEYTKFPNYKGVMQIKSKETYINDVKEGLALYNNYSEEIGVYAIQTGNYKQDKEEGQWTKIAHFDKILSYDECDYIKAIPAFKGSMFVKEIVIYSGGEKITPEGQQDIYYYPSNKIYRSFTLKNGKHINKDSYFYPDGKQWSTKVYDENSKYVSLESYYYNGSVKLKETMNPYSYEGYNQDGTPDQNTLMKQKEMSSRKGKAETLNQAVVDANKMADGGNLDQAISNLNSSILAYDYWRTNTYTYVRVETEELIAAKSALQLLDEKKNVQKLEKAKQLNEKARKQLLANDAWGAEQSSVDGLNLFGMKPTYLPLYESWALSLVMSRDYYQKGIGIIKQYSGGNIDDKLSWNDAIKKDLAEFVSKGIMKKELADKILADANLQ